MWGVHICAHATLLRRLEGRLQCSTSLLLSFDDGTQLWWQVMLHGEPSHRVLHIFTTYDDLLLDRTFKVTLDI